jgi:hypothetical protein
MLRVFIHLMILRAMTNISAGNRENNFWSERVRAPAVDLHTLVENVVATINTIIFSSLSLSPLSAALTFLPEVVVLGL